MSVLKFRRFLEHWRLAFRTSVRRQRARGYRPKLEMLEDRCLPSTFLVTNSGDNGGINPSPGANTGTLRQAIVDSNAATGTNTIDFDISPGGVQVITLAAALPAIAVSHPVVIDGTSQGLAGVPYTGSPLIELNGNALVNPTGL